MSTVPPPNLSLLPNQFYWETSTLPGRIWVGVPTTEDPTGRKMILDTSVVGAGFPEAPINGTTFGRKDAGWNAVLPLTGGILSGGLTISSVAAPTLTITAPSLGAGPLIALNNVASPNLPGGLLRASRNNSLRWDAQFASGDAESAGNAGSYFQLVPYSDGGVSLGVMFRLTRLGNGFLDVNSFAFGQAPRNSLFINPGATLTDPIILTRSGTGGLTLPPLTGPVTVGASASTANLTITPGSSFIAPVIFTSSATIKSFEIRGQVNIGTTSSGVMLAISPSVSPGAPITFNNYDSGGTFGGFRFSLGGGTPNTLTLLPGVAATNPITLTQSGTGGLVLPTLAGQLTLNTSGQPLVAPQGGTLIQVQGVDGQNGRINIDAVGPVAVGAIFLGRVASGTSAARAGLLLGQRMSLIGGSGYGATGYSTSPRASMTLVGAENWDDAKQGTYIAFNTTLIGGIVTTEKMRLTDGGALLIGKTASQGTFNLEVAGGANIDILQIGNNTPQNSLTITPGATLADPMTFLGSSANAGAVFQMPSVGFGITGFNNVMTITPGIGASNPTVLTLDGTGPFNFRSPIVVGGGANNALTITPGATLGNTARLDTSSGQYLLINPTNPGFEFGGGGVFINQAGASAAAAPFQVAGDIPNIATMLLDGYGSGANGAFLFGRGSTAAPGVSAGTVADGGLFTIGAGGQVGTTLTSGNTAYASISFRAAANWSTLAHATYITFSTTGAVGSASERMRLTNVGVLQIGTPAVTNTLSLAPGAALANPTTLSLTGSGGLQINPIIGFNGTAPITKPTIAGSRGGNAAVAALLTALASYGLITDSTTA